MLPQVHESGKGEVVSATAVQLTREDYAEMRENYARVHRADWFPSVPTEIENEVESPTPEYVCEFCGKTFAVVEGLTTENYNCINDAWTPLPQPPPDKWVKATRPDLSHLSDEESAAIINAPPSSRTALEIERELFPMFDDKKPITPETLDKWERPVEGKCWPMETRNDAEGAPRYSLPIRGGTEHGAPVKFGGLATFIEQCKFALHVLAIGSMTTDVGYVGGKWKPYERPSGWRTPAPIDGEWYEAKRPLPCAHDIPLRLQVAERISPTRSAQLYDEATALLKSDGLYWSDELFFALCGLIASRHVGVSDDVTNAQAADHAIAYANKRLIAGSVHQRNNEKRASAQTAALDELRLYTSCLVRDDDDFRSCAEIASSSGVTERRIEQVRDELRELSASVGTWLRTWTVAEETQAKIYFDWRWLVKYGFDDSKGLACDFVLLG